MMLMDKNCDENNMDNEIMKSKGKVWLVGAGPSDVNLLTVRARELIDRADLIVYDSLVGDAVLSLIPYNTETIDVGKRAGNHKVVQEEINRILCESALEGKNVLRLKGGDPFLFGRGGEELELLAENKIEFEIVPGVTSAVAVPAYNGIPVTHRDYVSSVHIITGHRRAGKDADIPFSELVKTNSTLVFLMGLSSLPFIIKGLIDAGMKTDMPAAVLQQGTTSSQKRVVATVGTIEDKVIEAGIHTPAIIVVGEVCGLSEKFSWYEKKALFGKKMIVTRPKDRASSLTVKLRELGAEVVEIPSIETKPLEINDTIQSVYRNLKEYQFILFTSPFGVKTFLQQLRELRIDIRSMGNVKIGAIGSATKKVLESAGLLVDYMPKIYSGSEFGKNIAAICNDGDQILIPRAEEGSREIVDELLKRKNISVTDLPIYKTVSNNYNKKIINFDFISDENCYVLFTSASSVKGFADIVKPNNLKDVKAFCIGVQTKAAADNYNMKTYVSKEASIDSLVSCVVQTVGNKLENVN